MTNLLEFTFISFTSLFVIIDPIGLIPTFLAITPTQTTSERIHMAKLASFIAFIILLLSFICGQWILKAFNVTLPAFEMAGGLILLLVGMDMVQARRTAVKETKEEAAEGASKEDIAVTPLAIPLLSGPGAITAVILLGTQAKTMAHQVILFVNLVVIFLLTFLILRTVARRANLFGVIMMKIMTRLMGLILCAIAVQFILNGIANAKIFIT